MPVCLLKSFIGKLQVLHPAIRELYIDTYCYQEIITIPPAIFELFLQHICATTNLKNQQKRDEFLYEIIQHDDGHHIRRHALPKHGGYKEYVSRRVENIGQLFTHTVWHQDMTSWTSITRSFISDWDLFLLNCFPIYKRMKSYSSEIPLRKPFRPYPTTH